MTILLILIGIPAGFLGACGAFALIASGPPTRHSTEQAAYGFAIVVTIIAIMTFAFILYWFVKSRK